MSKGNTIFLTRLFSVCSAEPADRPVTDRAVPVQVKPISLLALACIVKSLQVFAPECSDALRLRCLRMWLRDSSLQMPQTDIRNVLDWGYYWERLSSAILKIIVVPAALQRISNPVREEYTAPSFADTFVGTSSHST